MPNTWCTEKVHVSLTRAHAIAYRNIMIGFTWSESHRDHTLREPGGQCARTASARHRERSASETSRIRRFSDPVPLLPAHSPRWRCGGLAATSPNINHEGATQTCSVYQDIQPGSSAVAFAWPVGALGKGSNAQSFASSSDASSSECSNQKCNHLRYCHRRRKIAFEGLRAEFSPSLTFERHAGVKLRGPVDAGGA